MLYKPISSLFSYQASHKAIFKGFAWSGQGRLSTRSDRLDESLYPVTGCTLGTDVCHWMFKTKVNMVKMGL